MINRPAPNFFDSWFDLNRKLWNRCIAFYFFPLRQNGLEAFFSRQFTSWNTLIGKCLQSQFAALSALEPLRKPEEPTLLNDVSADAILADIEQSAEISLPEHHEFDTLIYPWHEAEKPAVERAPPVRSEVAKVA